jgi:hypothetical protein
VEERLGKVNDTRLAKVMFEMFPEGRKTWGQVLSILVKLASLESGMTSKGNPRYKALPSRVMKPRDLIQGA